MGFFEDNRPYRNIAATVSAQREAGIAAWEKDLNRPANSLLAEDFYGDSSKGWNDMASPETRAKPAEWKLANPKRKLIWSVPLTFKGTPLIDVARGLHDADFKNAARVIAAAQPDAVIRLGWEMNGKWMAWFAGPGQEHLYVDAYRRVASLFRAASPNFRFDWCTSFGKQDNDPAMAYPGDDVVDTIGMDVYDFIWTKAPISDPQQRWNRNIIDGDGRGLAWLKAFAARHTKKMSIGEWGVGLTDDERSPIYAVYRDDPAFIANFSTWLRQNADGIAYQVYFNAPPHRINGGTYPNALSTFRTEFLPQR